MLETLFREGLISLAETRRSASQLTEARGKGRMSLPVPEARSGGTVSGQENPAYSGSAVSLFRTSAPSIRTV
jgi:hypothetical protein